MAKNASGAAFLNSKKRAEEIALAQESGMNINEVYQDQDKFNMQHHHLLNCLENTTVSTRIINAKLCKIIIRSTRTRLYILKKNSL